MHETKRNYCQCYCSTITIIITVPLLIFSPGTDFVSLLILLFFLLLLGRPLQNAYKAPSF